MGSKAFKDPISQAFEADTRIPVTRERAIRERFNHRMKQIQKPTKALDMLRETGFGSFLSGNLTDAVWVEKEKQLDHLDNMLTPKL